MDHNEHIEQERQSLRRCVATLMWLARFCDWLAYFPRPLRHAVLSYFRPREALFRVNILARIEDFGFWSALPEMSWSHAGDTKEDALRLAIRFETLAGMIDELLEIADFSKAYEPDPLADLYEDNSLEYFCPAPLTRRSRKARDLFKPLLGLPCWRARIPDT